MEPITNVLRLTLLPEPKRLWIAALLSDEYLQGTGKLGYHGDDNKVYNCCLGVFCDVAKKAGLDINVTVDEETGTILYDGVEGLLPPRVYEWATGLTTESAEVDFEIMKPDNDERDSGGDPEAVYGSSLSEENDAEVPFHVIASYIQDQL